MKLRGGGSNEEKCNGCGACSLVCCRNLWCGAGR
ncbi:MAG: 4Fe-4S binding protein [Alphaproteobacteria bacterium]